MRAQRSKSELHDVRRCSDSLARVKLLLYRNNYVCGRVGVSCVLPTPPPPVVRHMAHFPHYDLVCHYHQHMETRLPLPPTLYSFARAHISVSFFERQHWKIAPFEFSFHTTAVQHRLQLRAHHVCTHAQECCVFMAGIFFQYCLLLCCLFSSNNDRQAICTQSDRLVCRFRA